MPLALILSSFVAASRIGGAAQQFVLAAHKIDPVLVPTVMIGRNPAKGSQGQVTPADLFARMLADIEADALFGMVDLVITGHFSSAEQVEIAAGVLTRIKTSSERAPVVIVDPILGDAPKGLYVRPEVAEGVAARLVPLADWITPNLWELGYLADTAVDDTVSVFSVPDEHVRLVVDVLDDAGWRLLSVAPKRASLEDYFSRLLESSPDDDQQGGDR